MRTPPVIRTLAATALLAGCAGQGAITAPAGSQGAGPSRPADSQAESRPLLDSRSGLARESAAYTALAEGRREDALADFQLAAEGGWPRAWLALATLRLAPEGEDLAGAAEALRRYREYVPVGAEHADALWCAALERQLAARQAQMRQQLELQRLKAELQKKEAAIRRLRELTLGR